MEIRAKTTFLDGTDRFEEGETYDVSEMRAGYFVGNGWAEDPSRDGEESPEPTTEPATLDIHDAVLPHRVK